MQGIMKTLKSRAFECADRYHQTGETHGYFNCSTEGIQRQAF